MKSRIPEATWKQNGHENDVSPSGRFDNRGSCAQSTDVLNALMMLIDLILAGSLTSRESSQWIFREKRCYAWKICNSPTILNLW